MHKTHPKQTKRAQRMRWLLGCYASSAQGTVGSRLVREAGAVVLWVLTVHRVCCGGWGGDGRERRAGEHAHTKRTRSPPKTCRTLSMNFKLNINGTGDSRACLEQCIPGAGVHVLYAEQAMP